MGFLLLKKQGPLAFQPFDGGSQLSTGCHNQNPHYDNPARITHPQPDLIFLVPLRQRVIPVRLPDGNIFYRPLPRNNSGLARRHDSRAASSIFFVFAVFCFEEIASAWLRSGCGFQKFSSSLFTVQGFFQVSQRFVESSLQLLPLRTKRGQLFLRSLDG